MGSADINPETYAKFHQKINFCGETANRQSGKITQNFSLSLTEKNKAPGKN